MAAVHSVDAQSFKRTRGTTLLLLCVLVTLSRPAGSDGGADGRGGGRWRGQQTKADRERLRGMRPRGRGARGDPESVVGAMLQDAFADARGATPVSAGSREAGATAPEGDWPSDLSGPALPSHEAEAPSSSQRPSELDSPGEGEWPTDSSAPEKRRGALGEPAPASGENGSPQGAHDTALERTSDPPAGCMRGSGAARRADEARKQTEADDEWIDKGDYADVERLRDLVRTDRALSAARGELGTGQAGSVFDEWTQKMHNAAMMYDRTAVEELVLQAQRNNAPGAPVMVRLPCEEEKSVDALTMTTGQLIEQILTDGVGLPRGPDGRVEVWEEGEAGDGVDRSWLWAVKYRMYEPFRSLFSHRVVDGFDLYSSLEDEPENVPWADESRERGASDAGVGQGDGQAEGDAMTDGDGGGDGGRDGGGKGRARRLHANDLLDIELGPYRAGVERFFTARTWTAEDAAQVVKWWEWHDNQTIARAPPGQPQLNARLWRAALRSRACEEAAELVRQGADVNSCDHAGDGMPVLHKAIFGQDVQGVELLVSLGADVEARDSGGRTALLAACSYGCADMAEVLLRAGADVLARDDDASNVLHCCAHATRQPRALVQLLVRAAGHSKVALPWLQVNRDGVTAAQEAERVGHEDMADYLDALARGESDDALLGVGLGPPPSSPRLPAGAGARAETDSSDGVHASASDAAEDELASAAANRDDTYCIAPTPVAPGGSSAAADPVGLLGSPLVQPSLRSKETAHSRRQAVHEARYARFRTYAGSEGWRVNGTGDYYDSTDRRHEAWLQETFVRCPEAFLSSEALERYGPALEEDQERLAAHEQATRRVPVHPLRLHMVDTALALRRKADERRGRGQAGWQT